MANEHEISAPGPLLDAQGRLKEPGFARSLVLDYDRKAIRVPAFRIKEWDYYCILAEDYGIALTIADNGYLGLVSATVLDLTASCEITESRMSAFPMGTWRLPASSRMGKTRAIRKDLRMAFTSDGGVRRLTVSWPDFGAKAAARTSSSLLATAGTGLVADIELTELAGGESMVIATPFPRAPRSFYYNQKINCQPARGYFRLGGREFPLVPERAFGVLDWGRGVWTYANTWLWGSASGYARRADSGKAIRFGFNLGYGFGDTQAASENMLFAEGKAHKLGRIAIELDDQNYLAPWRVRDEEGRLELRLEPILDRAASTNLLILASIQHQVFGRWNGFAILDDGQKVVIENLVGFCEKVRNRW